MRIMLLLATLLLPAGLVAQAPVQRGAFLLLLKGDTIAVERFTEHGDTLAGRSAARGQPQIEYQAVRGADGLVHTITMSVFGANAPADAAPIQQNVITMRGDSAIVMSGTRRIGIATKVGALPLMNNSFLFTELFTRRARALGDSVDIPAWSLNGGVTLTVSIRPLTTDSLQLTVAGQEHRLHVDATGHILGGTLPNQHLTILRVAGSAAATITLGKPDYSPPAGAPYTAREVTLKGQGGITLGGTLTLPTDATGKVPAVLTITGSGQQDRDESIPVAGGYRLFRQIADTLGRRGIAVLRLDDRMVGASAGTIGTSADYADDVRAALAWLRQQPEIDGNRLALVGHSEGGLIAPMVAATDSRLKGAVLMAGPSQTGRQIITFQQKQAIDAEPSIAPAARDSAYRAAMVTTDSMATPGSWLAFFLSHDPLATAKRVSKVPILILQGATDHQVTPEQAPALEKAFRAAGNRDVTMRLFPDLNHLFLPDPSGLPSGYAQLRDNKVAPQALGAMADWLVARLTKR